MWGLHLKQKGRIWHYYRAVPKEYSDVEGRKQISFTLKTGDFTEAKRKAAEISSSLESEWKDAKSRGISLNSQNEAERFRVATEIQSRAGFIPKTADELSDAQLLDRLRFLISGAPSNAESKAILGLHQPPEFSLSNAFERFWDYIKDEWSLLSHDQIRVKRNIYLKAIRNFESVVGCIGFHDVERAHAIQFRSWWIERLNEKSLKPYTGNREIHSLQRMFRVNNDIEGSSKTNPFSGIRLKEVKEVSRLPFSEDQILEIIKPGALLSLHADFRLLIKLLVNTGMRPVEAIGLQLDDIILDHETPHVHVRKNATRGLKTDHSERVLPVLGVSLEAAHALRDAGGWGKRLGKNMYATSTINRHLRTDGLVTDKRQSLYSLRHWFQDQLTKADVVDRAQAQLMGHKFHRPRYGYGKDLSELKEIVEKFAIK